MQLTTHVISPARNVALITDYAARLGLNLQSATTKFVDDQLHSLVEWSSSEIAVMCNRVFARETVEETWRDIDADSCRIWLTHYPINDIESIFEGDNALLTEDVDYEVDMRAGKVRRLGTWSEPVIVTYTGGYNLPFEAPLALQQAAILMTREAYYQSTRGDATTRMVAHKDSRVIYFDPNARGATGGGGGSAGSPARRASADLLKHFMRFEV